MQWKESLIHKALIKMGVRISILIFIATAISYYHMMLNLKEQSLEQLEKYIIERGHREENLFTLAKDNHATLRQAVLDELASNRSYNYSAEFNRLYVRHPDGVIRNRDELFDGTKQSGVYIDKNLKITPELQKQIIIFSNAALHYGMAWRNRFQDTYISTPENVMVVYWPEQSDWAQVASADLYMPDEEYLWVADKEHNPKRTTVWTGLFYDEVSGFWMISCATPIDFDGKHIATIGHDIVLNELMERTIKNHLEGSYNLIIRKDGRLIVHPDKIEDIKKNDGIFNILESDDEHLKRIFSLAKHLPENKYIIQNPVDEEYLAISRVRGPDWYFVTVFPESILFERAFSSARFVLLLGILSLLLEMILLYYIFRDQVARPLKDFITATGRIASGVKDIVLNTERRDELGVLAVSFTKMAREVQMRRKRLEILLEGTKNLASTHNRFHALANAAHVVAHEIFTNQEVNIFVYFPLNTENSLGKYAQFPLNHSNNYGERMLPSNERLEKLLSVTELPLEWKEVTYSKEGGCFVVDADTLLVAAKKEKEVLGLLEIQGLKSCSFGETEKDFVDALCHSLSIALDNININEHLEDKVQERTHELQKALANVEALKMKQDGDYYLTSLLIKPLGTFEVRSERVKVRTLVKQKTQFQFRQWKEEIGGDICIAHTMQLEGRPTTVFINADAMGKSIQGAGGALVLGSVFNSIVERTKMFPELQEQSLSIWMQNAFLEMHEIFTSFDGSMLISLVLGMVDERVGLLHYVNAEHPNLLLYRDGKAQWLPLKQIMRKLGSHYMESKISVETFQLEHNDVIIVGSDGRDDVKLYTSEENSFIFNQDETMFVRHVERGNGDLKQIFASILASGELTDDISLLRLDYIVQEDLP